MYTIQPKKLLLINILDILRKYSDAEHRLSQKNIIDILASEYDMKAERKAIKRNLTDLIYFGYEIEYTETKRVKKNGEEEILLTDWYLVREFSDAELRLLIDSLLFSKHITYKQYGDLIKKLESLSSRYFNAKVKHIQTLPTNTPENKQLFFNIEVLDKAISEKKQVEFQYNDFGIDKKMHPRLNDNGEVRRYLVNPYQMAAINGRYYLICNYDKYSDVANYRVDRITKIKLLDTLAKPIDKLEGLKNGLDLPKHMVEHIYMFGGKSERVTFKAKKDIINEVIDWFGNDAVFSDETEDEITVSVFVNISAMRKWALQYALYVRVISPQDLVDGLREDIAFAMKSYEL